MKHVLLVGLGGCLGSVARYGLSTLVTKQAGSVFPWGTLAVNVIGCFAIGAVLHFVEDREALGQNARFFAAVGILGGFTTFSAFGHETLGLLDRKQFGLAAMNVLMNVCVGLAAVWAGRGVCRLSS